MVMRALYQWDPSESSRGGIIFQQIIQGNDSTLPLWDPSESSLKVQPVFVWNMAPNLEMGHISLGFSFKMRIL